MSSNPYELRTQLLQQAQDILRSKFVNEHERVRYLCDRDMVNPKSVVWPHPPTTEQIIEVAERLYTFVQTK